MKLIQTNKKRLSATIAGAIVLVPLLATTVSAAAVTNDAATTFMGEMLDILGLVLIAIGGGLGIWGIVNLLEGYGSDQQAAKSSGMKQLMAGIGVAIVGVVGVEALKDFVDTLWE